MVGAFTLRCSQCTGVRGTLLIPGKFLCVQEYVGMLRRSRCEYVIFYTIFRGKKRGGAKNTLVNLLIISYHIFAVKISFIRTSC